MLTTHKYLHKGLEPVTLINKWSGVKQQMNSHARETISIICYSKGATLTRIERGYEA